MGKPYFVTLTVKSCKADKLSLYIGKVLEGFSKIRERNKKRFQIGNGIKLIGVKSLECNFNPLKKTYNPHLHLIVANKEIGELIINEWIDIWTYKKTNINIHTNRKGQDIRKVFDVETNLIEIIKYGSKIFTEPDIKKKGKDNNNYQIYVSALDNILTAMKGKRIFERFGFNIEKQTKNSTGDLKVLTDYEEWDFNPSKANWENVMNEKPLTNYKLPSKLSAILENSFNITMQ